jgi:adenine-specific DNA-methyltransferase
MGDTAECALAQPSALLAAKAASSDPSLLTVARATARRLQAVRPLSGLARVKCCLSLLSSSEGNPDLADLSRLLACLPIDERHYWIGTLYTLLLPPKTRRDQATYFTPPHLAEAIINLAIEAGFDIEGHRALDPAAGGAAFLSTLAARKLALGVPAANAARGLRGIEIDAGLAEISRVNRGPAGAASPE